MKELNDYPYWKAKAHKKGFKAGLLIGFISTILIAIAVDYVILMFI